MRMNIFEVFVMLGLFAMSECKKCRGRKLIHNLTHKQEGQTLIGTCRLPRVSCPTGIYPARLDAKECESTKADCFKTNAFEIAKEKWPRAKYPPIYVRAMETKRRSHQYDCCITEKYKLKKCTWKSVSVNGKRTKNFGGKNASETLQLQDDEIISTISIKRFFRGKKETFEYSARICKLDPLGDFCDQQKKKQERTSQENRINKNNGDKDGSINQNDGSSQGNNNSPGQNNGNPNSSPGQNSGNSNSSPGQSNGGSNSLPSSNSNNGNGGSAGQSGGKIPGIFGTDPESGAAVVGGLGIGLPFLLFLAQITTTTSITTTPTTITFTTTTTVTTTTSKTATTTTASTTTSTTATTTSVTTTTTTSATTTTTTSGTIFCSDPTDRAILAVEAAAALAHADTDSVSGLGGSYPEGSSVSVVCVAGKADPVVGTINCLHSGSWDNTLTTCQTPCPALTQMAANTNPDIVQAGPAAFGLPGAQNGQTETATCLSATTFKLYVTVGGAPGPGSGTMGPSDTRTLQVGCDNGRWKTTGSNGGTANVLFTHILCRTAG